MKQISKKTIRKNLYYDPKTGIFTRRLANCNSVKVGEVAGGVDAEGYLVIRINKTKYMAHRLALIYTHGKKAIKNKFADHINHNRMDNRLENLRIVTKQENSQNRLRSKNNTSSVSGVHFAKHCNKWQSRISIQGERINLGLFTCFTEAVKVRREAEVRYGFHKNHGKDSHS